MDRHLYLVGGIVRDHLRKTNCADVDFAAKNARGIARHFAAKTQSACVPLDTTPGRETFRVVIEKQFNFDFTEMQGESIEEDLAQRDFSINAMAMRLADFLHDKDILIDPNRGLADLNNKIVRVVPGPVFSSDPCRMLRAFRFASALNFEIEPETLNKIEREKANLKKTAPERIYREWILFLGGRKVYNLLRLMDRSGLLEYALPETAALRESGAARTWELSMETFNRLENHLSEPEAIFPVADGAGFFSGRNFALLKFASLLLHLTPLSSTSRSIPRGKSEGFSKVTTALKRLRAGNADIQFIHRTILCQREAADSNLDFAGKEFDESKIYRFVKNNESELTSGLFLACAVKSTSENSDERKIKAFYQAARRISGFYFQRYLPAMSRGSLLDGNDLIRHFKLSPSPLFKTILDRVEEARVLGSLQSKSEAETAARNIIESQ